MVCSYEEIIGPDRLADQGQSRSYVGTVYQTRDSHDVDEKLFE